MARRTEISPGEVITIAMAGNPNVGKSTLFNAVTGLNQHTGNWPGKTVASAEGLCRHGGKAYRLVDLPGTYSLLAHSAEEEVARNFLCFSRPEAVCIVCDATCLERNLNLVLQTLEITPRAAICLNLMDEAKKRKLRVEPARLEALRQKLETITGKKIDLATKIDPSVLGGIRLDIEGTELDGTVQNRLATLRRNIAAATL